MSTNSLEQTGFMRLAAILAPRGPIPVSKSTWWSGVKLGRFPKPVKLGPRTTAWRVEDIRSLIERVGELSKSKTVQPGAKSGASHELTN